MWLFDHFHTVPQPTDEITFESFTSLAALAALTKRVRLGHVVMCTAFRNPALTAKMISTMDVISGGRMDLGIGAGWKRDEWDAYGYGFPETKERLAPARRRLGVIAAMLAGDKHEHATFAGDTASRTRSNIPKPIQQPRVPIMVGGNGPNVTWRLAAKYADELNVDGMEPADAEALPVIRARCEEIGRDPETLALSVQSGAATCRRTRARSSSPRGLRQARRRPRHDAGAGLRRQRRPDRDVRAAARASGADGLGEPQENAALFLTGLPWTFTRTVREPEGGSPGPAVKLKL